MLDLSSKITLFQRQDPSNREVPSEVSENLEFDVTTNGFHKNSSESFFISILTLTISGRMIVDHSDEIAISDVRGHARSLARSQREHFYLGRAERTLTAFTCVVYPSTRG